MVHCALSSRWGICMTMIHPSPPTSNPAIAAYCTNSSWQNLCSTIASYWAPREVAMGWVSERQCNGIQFLNSTFCSAQDAEIFLAIKWHWLQTHPWTALTSQYLLYPLDNHHHHHQHQHHLHQHEWGPLGVRNSLVYPLDQHDPTLSWAQLCPPWTNIPVPALTDWCSALDVHTSISIITSTIPEHTSTNTSTS